VGLEVRAVKQTPTPQRTYWHLEKLDRRPSDYDIGSSSVLYYLPRGFEVKVPLDAWYATHQRSSPFVVRDGERFRDPRETTYSKYTELQQTKEAFVDGLLRQAEEAGRDALLLPEWRSVLSRVLPTLRYPVHGLQMIASYVAQMAPSGRIVIAGVFQAADEVRRVQRLAYRMRQLELADDRTTWQSEPAWQPTREFVEKLLVTYDWGEAFVALNLVWKPRFDELWMRQFAARAQAAGDDLLARIFLSLDEDCRWHRDWSRALVRTAIEEHAPNRETLAGWVARWTPLAQQATAQFGHLVGPEAAGAAESAARDALVSAGLPSPEGV